MGFDSPATQLAPMTADAQTLDDLRVEIDEIDDAIHYRLLRRAEIVARLKALKPDRGAAGAMRPEREAEIIARRLSHHRGPLSRAAVYGMWREIVAASLALQGPFSIAVGAPRDAVRTWDLARVHFGSAATMRLHRSPAAALRVVERDPTVFAVLPVPAAGEAKPWWPRLADRDGAGPWVVARLPWFEPAGHPAALLVAHADLGAGAGAVRMAAVPSQTREPPVNLGRVVDTVARSSGYLHLMEIGADATVVGLGAVSLGGYLPPLRLADLAEDRR